MDHPMLSCEYAIGEYFIENRNAIGVLPKCGIVKVPQDEVDEAIGRDRCGYGNPTLLILPEA